MASRVESPVGQCNRPPLSKRTTPRRLTRQAPCPPGRAGPTRGTRNKEKLVQASRSPMRQRIPDQPRLIQIRRGPLKTTDPRIQAKCCGGLPRRLQRPAATDRGRGGDDEALVSI